MDRLIEKFNDKGLGRLMDESRDGLALSDEIYINDRKDENELERRYESLDLSWEQRMVINDYLASTSIVNHRYADISYMAGIKDTISMLVSLGLVKGL